jgi:nicotinate dehydrogenase subunit B
MTQQNTSLDRTSRRRFLQLFAGGIAVFLVSGGALPFRRQEDTFDMPEELPPDEISAWLHIAEDGGVTVYTGKVEVGQNIRTSLAQAVAEELRVPVDAITMIMGDTDRTPYDRGTFGSQTTPRMNPQLRRAAAAAREMLLDQAAKTWSTDAAALTVAGGRIADPATGKALTYGELTKGQKLMQTIPAGIDLRPAKEWTVAGTPVPKAEGREFVTGRHEYPSDKSLPGMLFGKILRPPSYGAKLVRLDASGAKAVDGAVVVHEGDFIGVAAPTSQAATRALAALRAEWREQPQPSREELFDLLKDAAAPGRRPHRTGSVANGLNDADLTNEQVYLADYIAHAPLEPRAALAQWSGGKLTVWTGTQRPFGVRSELMSAFDLPEERVRVLMPDTGSGYGGKHTGEAALEAARLAKAAGKPVKLVWTRQEEFTWAYFRPAARIEVHSGVKNDGTLTAWEFHTYNAGGAGIETYYETPNQHIEAHRSDSPLRQGSYRGLAATVNHFARESHIDELAHRLRMDPLEFRLKNLKNPRMINVLKAAAEKFGWDEHSSSSGRGFGIACGFDKGSYVATCAEVAVERSGAVSVLRVAQAFECGAIVNPEHLENQVEGAIVQGLGGALFERIEFGNGQIFNPFFSDYRLPRFSDLPNIEVVLLDRPDLPSEGAGETPMMGIAPAVGNAIFSATGVRLRALPLAPNGLVMEK